MSTQVSSVPGQVQHTFSGVLARLFGPRKQRMIPIPGDRALEEAGISQEHRELLHEKWSDMWRWEQRALWLYVRAVIEAREIEASRPDKRPVPVPSANMLRLAKCSAADQKTITEIWPAMPRWVQRLLWHAIKAQAHANIELLRQGLK